MEHFDQSGSETFLIEPFQLEQLKDRLIAKAVENCARLEDPSVVFEYWTLRDIKRFARTRR